MRVNVRNAVRRGFYLDSAALMRLSREIAALPRRRGCRADDGDAGQQGAF
mgnify:CR=1 FL=1